MTVAPGTDERRIHDALRALIDPPPAPAPEPRWDWRRLRHWPHAGLAAACIVALAPVFGGQSLATGWGTVLRQCREQQSVGGAWTIAGITVLVAVTSARWRPRWYSRCAVIICLFGTALMSSPFDLITLMTGVTQ